MIIASNVFALKYRSWVLTHREPTEETKISDSGLFESGMKLSLLGNLLGNLIDPCMISKVLREVLKTKEFPRKFQNVSG